jgi:hypothetical protein
MAELNPEERYQLRKLQIDIKDSCFLAGKKLPSRKARLQSSFPALSREVGKALQTLSQVPSLGHWSSRRQHVTELPYRSGRFFQRHPARST